MSAPSLWVDRPHPARLETPHPPPRVPRTPAHRRPPRPRPVVVDGLMALAAVGLGITVALGVGAESAGSLRADGGWATAAGRVSGLIAAYAMVVVVLLSARIPPLERVVGQDRLIAWHRRVGPWPLYGLVAHGVLITVGYAQAAHDGVLHQFGQLVWTYPGILASVVGSVALVAAGVTSYRKARRRMAYETWWAVHLYAYLALFLAFFHQVDTGASFVGHPAARTWWSALWAGTLGIVLGCRIGLPAWRSLRHRVEVAEVVPEGPGTVSVVLRGRRLDRLPVSGGQFLQWRILRRGLWWQAHPYSLSSVPSGDELRITVKDLGDHSAALARVRPGTRVAIEGPYGALTADARRTDRLLLVGAGVGTAPLRAMLDDLPGRADVVVLLRGSSPEAIPLRSEIAERVRALGGRVHVLPGHRDQVRMDRGAMLELVPDLARRDVYVCGPEGLMDTVLAAAAQAGVPADRIHHESFAL